ncbi:hypothetical protein BaRGS_00005428 [Batillaria attramentaria]|uniref:Uncharacterized protein n=1 Tax=Batillaria attramentaria TaxID=370345 RepID=A0ABD0LVH4_9CAEN
MCMLWMQPTFYSAPIRVQFMNPNPLFCRAFGRFTERVRACRLAYRYGTLSGNFNFKRRSPLHILLQHPPPGQGHANKK